MQTEDLRDLYIDQLKDLYSAENQLVKALPKMAKAAASPELKAAFEEHLEETKGQVELPVSRYDIADYLAVSVETVCRSITDLQQRGVITLAGKRTVKILNRGALEDRFGKNSMAA